SNHSQSYCNCFFLCLYPFRHPLFPLLALLFEKCEQATQGSECITSASFDVDIENFVHQQERDHKPFFSEDPELDNLMVKAIQVLRIHLLELEKVNELCKDFCNRYITCLKTKMHSDNLLRNDLGGPYSPTQTSLSISVNPSGIVVPAGGLQQGNVSMTTINSQVVSGGTLYQPVAMVTSQGQVLTQALPSGTIQIQNSQVNVDLSSLLDNEDKKCKNKRGVLPKHATNIMRSWLFQHLMHPYPTEDEKRQIAAQTSLTLLQVNNWFINARRRILQPMLDASNPDPAPKAKKMKSQHRPTQRFWPDSIVAGVLQTHRSQTGNDSRKLMTYRLMFIKTQSLLKVNHIKSEKNEEKATFSTKTMLTECKNKCVHPLSLIQLHGFYW
uniref:Pbx/knotted 1 homeobox 2 n=1 Tax=Sphaeramia orbicularis TaxID=375764 RepID=A0A673A8T8_9TELE